MVYRSVLLYSISKRFLSVDRQHDTAFSCLFTPVLSDFKYVLFHAMCQISQHSWFIQQPISSTS